MEKVKVYSIIHKFINDMEYLKNDHVLGIYFYGSYQIGCANANSDIDLHVVFDDSKPDNLVRGTHFIDGFKIEYFEKPISDLKLTIDNDYINQNNAMLSIVGTSEIIFDRTGSLKDLQMYALDIYSKPLPPLSENEAKEYVSIINNRMEKLQSLAYNCDAEFYHLYHLTIEKIRKFYHRLIGSSKLSTSKVYRVYTDEKYRKLTNKGIMPEEEFRNMYMDAILDSSTDMYVKFKKVQELFNYASRSVDLNISENYRIPIRSRNNPDFRRY